MLRHVGPSSVVNSLACPFVESSVNQLCPLEVNSRRVKEKAGKFIRWTKLELDRAEKRKGGKLEGLRGSPAQTGSTLVPLLYMFKPLFL